MEGYMEGYMESYWGATGKLLESYCRVGYWRVGYMESGELYGELDAVLPDSN